MKPRIQAFLILAPLLLWGALVTAADNFVLDPEQVRPRDIKEQEAVEPLEGSLTMPPWPRDADLIAFVARRTLDAIQVPDRRQEPACRSDRRNGPLHPRHRVRERDA